MDNSLEGMSSSSEEGRKIEFRAKVGETEHSLQGSLGQRILEIKADLEAKTGIPSSMQKWIYQGKILTDAMTIAESGLVSGHAIHVLKSAAPIQNNNSSSSSNSSSAVVAPAPSIATLPVTQVNSGASMTAAPPMALILAFDNSMKVLLNNSEEQVKQAVGTLVKILHNIVQNPLEEKYRKIKVSNAAFNSKIQIVSGGSRCMSAIGFVQENGEWVLKPSAVGWNLLVACKAKLDTFNEKLSKLPASDVSAAGINPSSPVNTSNIHAPPPTPSVNPSDVMALQELLRNLAAMQPPR